MVQNRNIKSSGHHALSALLIAERERSIYDSCRFDIGRFRADPTNYERCPHPSDTLSYHSVHNNLFLTLRVIHKLKRCMLYTTAYCGGGGGDKQLVWSIDTNGFP